MNEHEIKGFWQQRPCGESLIGGIEKYGADYENFFADYDRFRYATESHIPECLEEIGFNQKRVLEIGLGQGADAEQIIRRGGVWTGVDLTHAAAQRTLVRLTLRQLPHNGVAQGSALALPFADNSFDIVFSHGVLHHIPDIRQAQKEIHRVLRPDGKLVAMLYAKNSLNYRFSISVVRRLGLLGLYFFGRKSTGKIGGHLENARREGIFNYLKMPNFIHRNTDGPGNPYSKVYDLAEIKTDFPDFTVERVFKRFMHAPPLPVRSLPLEKMFGWHLWVYLRPRQN